MKKPHLTPEQQEMEDTIFFFHETRRYIAFVVMIPLALLSLYLLTNRKFRHHPYPLIGLTCLAEATWYSWESFEKLWDPYIWDW